MNPPWTDEILASMERDYRNHPDVADLIAGVRCVLALHCAVGVYDVCEHTNGDECDPWETVDGDFVCGAPVGHVCEVCCDESGEPLDHPCATVRALNDPNGA